MIDPTILTVKPRPKKKSCVSGNPTLHFFLTKIQFFFRKGLYNLKKMEPTLPKVFKTVALHTRLFLALLTSRGTPQWIGHVTHNYFSLPFWGHQNLKILWYLNMSSIDLTIR